MRKDMGNRVGIQQQATQGSWNVTPNQVDKFYEWQEIKLNGDFEQTQVPGF